MCIDIQPNLIDYPWTSSHLLIKTFFETVSCNDNHKLIPQFFNFFYYSFECVYFYRWLVSVL